MSKETRTDKYRNYRESAREGEDVNVEMTDSEDDFLSFMKKDESEEEELHPLSYDTLKNDEAVNSALKSMKAKNDYDTKMDILNRLKAEQSESNVDLENCNTQEFGHDVHEPLPQVKSEEKPVKKEDASLDEVDDASLEKAKPLFKESEPVTLSRKEVKALKKQEKTALKIEKEEAKKSEAIKAAPPKREVKKSKTSVISRILDIIVIILMIVVMIFIVYTIRSII